MVLRTLALVVLVAGCNQSLFDNNVGGGSGSGPDGGGSGSGDGNMMVATMCPAGCLGDAADDIDGGRPGWRYLEDARNRTWAPMTAATDGFVGAVSPNAIETCTANPTAAACVALPGALLLTSAGNTAAADPALEFTVGSNTVVTLTVRVYVPTGQPEQRIRLYRNSREDVLFTANAAPGSLFERAINVDALAADRFLVALAPSAMGAAQVGVHFYISPTGEGFPKECQLAVDFASAGTNTVPNACGAAVEYREWDDMASMSNLVAPQLATQGPYAELGTSADIPLPRYYVSSDVLVRNATTSTTTQLWVRHDAFDSTYNAHMFSDIDLDAAGGIEISLYDNGGNKRMYVGTCTSPSPLAFAETNVDFPDDTNWHFVRVVHDHAMGQVRICVDGVRLGSLAVPAGGLQSTYAPRFGRNVVWTPIGAFFDGGVDDVRSFATALPCDP